MNRSLSEQSQWELDSILPEECFACGLELLRAAPCHFNELCLPRACVNGFFMQAPHSQRASEGNALFWEILVWASSSLPRSIKIKVSLKMY